MPYCRKFIEANVCFSSHSSLIEYYFQFWDIGKNKMKMVEIINFIVNVFSFELYIDIHIFYNIRAHSTNMSVRYIIL